jgi:hypothetical protein
MTLDFYFSKELIFLKYQPEYELTQIIEDIKVKNFKKSNTFRLSYDNLYILNEEDELILYESLLDNENFLEDSLFFLIGTLKDEYYQMKTDVLELKNDLFIHKDFDFKIDYFIGKYKISIFKKIDSLINQDIFIGYEESEITPEDFYLLIKDFPTSYEREIYYKTKVQQKIENFFYIKKDYEHTLSKYLDKKEKTFKNDIYTNNINKKIYEYELEKNLFIKNKLNDMINNEQYTEHHFQKELIKILLILFPKYCYVLKEITIKNKKRVDYILIDYNGNIDIIEIKTPFYKLLNKADYRKNYYPSRVLTGSIMQTEKYLYYLNENKRNNEKIIQKKLKQKYNIPLDINIVNPKGFIIMGRSNDFDELKTIDFEIIKRKYKNMVDIISYDDLLNRLNFLINKYNISN